MSDRLSIKEEDIPDVDLARTRTLSSFWQVLVTLVGSLAIALSIYQIFKLDARLNELAAWLGLGFKPGYALLVNEYLYALVGLMLATVFIVFPTYQRQRRDVVPFYDVLAALVTLHIPSIAQHAPGGE